MAGGGPVEIDESVIYRDLCRLRRRGYWNLTGLELPAITALAQLLDSSTSGTVAIKVERTLNLGVAQLGKSEYAEAASLLLGVAPRSRGLRVGERRAKAASAYGDMAPETFRTRHEKALLQDLAAHLFGLVGTHLSLRQAPIALGVQSGAASNTFRRSIDVGPLWPSPETTSSTSLEALPASRSLANLTRQVRQRLGNLCSEHGEVELQRLLETVDARRQNDVRLVLRELRRLGAVSWNGEPLTEKTSIRVHSGYERMRLRPSR